MNSSVLKLLQSAPSFAHVDLALLELLSSKGVVENYLPDQLILVKGEIPRGMYVILQGMVIIHDEDFIFSTLGMGSFLGEYSMLDSQPGTVTASSVNNAQLLFIDRSFFEDLIHNNIQFRNMLFALLARRLRKHNHSEQLHLQEIVKAKQERSEIINKSREIEVQQAFILNQGDKVYEQNFKITESIQYAKRIQKALLPSKEETDALWPEHFILYKPKSIVGGDFYWTKHKDNKLYITAADCTGHGVPGAFMCMLGITALNQIIDDTSTHILTAAEILNRLRVNVIQTLKQRSEGSTSRDGMDISFCILDIENRTMQYAGANNPVYIVRNNEVIQIKADKMPVGRYINDTVPFNNNVFELQNDDAVYLFSDGYSDQFDTENKYKFGPKRFRELLSRIAMLPMVEQKIILTQTIKEWRGLQKQLDDIVVIGIKISF